MKKNIPFLIFFLVVTTIIGIFYQQPQIAMWIGFGLAAFSTISNDSIQTLGTFLTSNRKVKWWVLWLFIGGIAVITHGYGWIVDSGDIAFERLSKIPPVETFTFFQIYSPVVLLLLTWFRIPVSTTFLILATFSNSKTIEAMLSKTFTGYIVAITASMLIWGFSVKFLSRFYKKKPLSPAREKTWRTLQWCTTSFLWITWLMQDTANIAVFLPRTLSLEQFIAAIGIIFSLVGIVFYFKGGRIQSIVTEKKDVQEVRAATMIDLVLAFILLFFKEINTLPMSTTWVFLGVLAGREIALVHFFEKKRSLQRTFALIGKDVVLASVGLVISIALAWLSKSF